MRIVPGTALVCAIVLAFPAAPVQPAPSATAESARMLADLAVGVGAYHREATSRGQDLLRRADVLELLVQAGEAITLQVGSLQVGPALQKVEDARRQASHPHPFGPPVPDVLDEVKEILERPPFAITPQQLRLRTLVALERLEKDLVEQAEKLQAEATRTQALIASVAQTESAIRAAAITAARISVEVRKGALGMRLEMRPPAGSRLPVSSGSSSPDLQDRVRAYLDDAGSRLHDLGRRIEVLTLLVRGADAIPVDGGAVYLSGARPKLEEARVRAAQPFPLGTPVPSVLTTVGQVLDRPPFGANPGQVRGLSFSAVTPLERQVVETGEGLAAEGEQLFGLIGKLLQVENGLRQAVVETLGEAADVRRRALGIPRPPVPKI